MILGVILAGGRGIRLGGVIKANIEIAGITLVDRVVEALREQCDALVLSTGKFEPQAIKSTLQLPTTADATGVEAGPVSGLAAAVVWARMQKKVPDFILTVAVDTPFFPQDFAGRAMALMQPGVNCVMGAAMTEEEKTSQAYPTNTLWRFSAIAALPELLETPNAPHGLRNVVDAKNRVLVEYPALSAAGCFDNVNTQADLERCSALADSPPQESK